ncbi:unnamed protein product [Closterium sp. NIES-53]
MPRRRGREGVPEGAAGHGKTVEKLARIGPPEGSARETATGRLSGVSVVQSRKKEREAPESRVKVWRTWADVVPERADSPAPEAADTLAPRAATSPPGSGGRHSPRQVSPARDLSGARELVTPRVCQAAETALSGVQAPALLTSVVARRGLTTALLLLALTTTGSTPLRRAATSATAASATSATASATSASSASTAATDASTPARVVEAVTM